MSPPTDRKDVPTPQAWLRWPSPCARAWCLSLLSAAQDANVKAIVAVGSWVRPVGQSEDADLVLIAQRPEILHLRPPIEVDLRSFGAADVDELIGSGNDLLGWAVTYGVALYDRDGFWRRVHERWLGGVPLPSAGVFEKRRWGA